MGGDITAKRHVPRSLKEEKMRLLVTSVLLLSLLISASFAEQLVTANPIGQGRWSLTAGYLMDSNVSNVSGMTLSTIGGYVGYGINSACDVYLNLGSGSVGGTMLVGISGATMTGIGLSAKYAVLNESDNMPAVSAAAGYKSLSASTNIVGGGSISTTGSQIMVGAQVSKMFAPFTPYAGLAYRANSFNTTASNYNQLDLTVGSAIGWSAQGAAYLEYTMQSVTPNAGSGYTQGQLSVGAGYKI